jgi:glycolate oxidase FAD binding subunit
MLRSYGAANRLDEAASTAQWRAIANLETLPGGEATILRLSVAPSKGLALLGEIRRLGGKPVLLDQGGGLIFVTLPPGLAVAQAALAAARSAGGHAMPLRADAEIRNGLSWFGRRDGPQASLAERVRKSFDPAGILNPGFAGA